MRGGRGVVKERRERTKTSTLAVSTASKTGIPSTEMSKSLTRVPLAHLTWLLSVTNPDWTSWNNKVMLSSLQSQGLGCRVLGRGEDEHRLS